MSGRELFSDAKYLFSESKGAKRLRDLAKAPFDLTRGLDGERLDRMVVEACGLKLVYGTQRVDDEVVSTLWELAREARVFEKMEAMQAGAVINFISGHESEERAVLHTAMRDLFDHKNKAPAAREAAELAQAECDKLEKFCKGLDQDNRWTDMVCIGIGGSELGPKMLYNALQSYGKGRSVHYISNIDPDDIALALGGRDLKNTLVLSVSKSGSTLETKTNEDIVRAHFEKAGLKPDDHFVCVTGKGSPMDDPSSYRDSFYMWDYVGGRYCGTSMVGGVMIAFAYGMKVYLDVCRGAHAMDLVALKDDPRENLPLMAALLGIWNRNFLGCPTLAVIPYSRLLDRFAAHIQQLDMESNGKHIDRQGRQCVTETGPIIWGEPATNAQHSFFQLIHQGTNTIPLEFIGFRESQFGVDMEVQGTTSQEKLLANLLAQAVALATGQESANPNKEFKGNRPSSILLGKRLDPYTLGAILSLYENKVVFQGFIWNINSFDQEGVQLGKVLANKVLQRQVCRKNGKEGEEFPVGDALLDIIDDL